MLAEGLGQIYRVRLILLTYFLQQNNSEGLWNYCWFTAVEPTDKCISGYWKLPWALACLSCPHGLFLLTGCTQLWFAVNHVGTCIWLHQTLSSAIGRVSSSLVLCVKWVPVVGQTSFSLPEALCLVCMLLNIHAPCWISIFSSLHGISTLENLASLVISMVSDNVFW